MTTRFLRRSVENDRGASAVEYGLMVAAIAALIVGIVFGLGGVISDAFTDTCDGIAIPAGQSNIECG